MDSARRGSRMVIDPKVRQVGFVTPGTEPQQTKAQVTGAATEAATEAGAANSPSPVMIPPLRHTAEGGAPSQPVPVPVPVPVSSPTLRRQQQQETTMPLGSYNPSDTVLGTSPGGSYSSRNGTDRGYMTVYSEDFRDELESQPEPRPQPQPQPQMRRSGADSSNPNPNFVHRLPLAAASVPSGEVMRPGAGAGTFTVAGSLPPITALPQPSKPPVSGAEETDSKQKPLKVRTSKAERRAIQDAQRAAKAAVKETGGNKGVDGGTNKGGDRGAGVPAKETKGSKLPQQKKDSNADKRSVATSEKRSTERGPEKDKKKDIPAIRMQFDDEHRVAKAKRRSLVEQTETKNRVELFRHLPQYVHGIQLPALEAKFFQEDSMHPHPAVYKVGLQYLTGDIVGGNARCVAMLSAFREAIKDYNTPPKKTLVRDLTAKINSYISFLITCRPLSISMGNAIKFLKARIAKLAVTLSESEAKSQLLSDINRFIYEKIVFADRVIVKHAVTKIRDGDVLLTYGSSCVVEMILLHAHELGRKFRVVVVDSRPKLEGQAMLRRLLAAGLNCTYTLINGISYIMQEVTRVFLGAASVLSNGTVYSRVGTACVAMVANASHVPVLICCEAYKFHERVQLDSICSNELGDPDVLAKVPGRKDFNQLEGWTNNEHLRLLNLTYDATPADYVSMIVTDYGMVPPTSVPVIVREYRREYLLI